MHWKKLNFPSEDCQNTKNQSAFGVGKSWTSLLPIIHMEHGLCNSQGLGKNDPSRRRTMAGPQALTHQKAGAAQLVGLKGLSCSTGGILSKHSVLASVIFLMVPLGEPRKGPHVPGSSGNPFPHGMLWSSREGGRPEAETCPLRGRGQPRKPNAEKTILFHLNVSGGTQYPESTLLFPRLPVCIWIGRASVSELVHGAIGLTPHLSGPFRRAKGSRAAVLAAQSSVHTWLWFCTLLRPPIPSYKDQLLFFQPILKQAANIWDAFSSSLLRTGHTTASSLADPKP